MVGFDFFRACLCKNCDTVKYECERFYLCKNCEILNTSITEFNLASKLLPTRVYIGCIDDL